MISGGSLPSDVRARFAYFVLEYRFPLGVWGSVHKSSKNDSQVHRHNLPNDAACSSSQRALPPPQTC